MKEALMYLIPIAMVVIGVISAYNLGKHRGRREGYQKGLGKGFEDGMNFNSMLEKNGLDNKMPNSNIKVLNLNDNPELLDLLEKVSKEDEEEDKNAKQ